MRALLAEDDDAVRRLVCRVLALRGWTVSVLRRARDILDIPRAERFDLAVLDVELGDEIDGIAVARWLIQRDPAMRIVMMSGNPAHAPRVKAAGLGPLLAKPFQLRRLAERIDPCERA